MKRDLYNHLVQWGKREDRKPLLLRGARQVGKSWLVREWGKTYKHFVEINFEENPDFKTFFEGDLDPRPLCKNLSNYLGQKISPEETLLFLDEIQLCPRAVTALRYFYEKMPALPVIGAGSLLEFELKNISIPVGRVESLYLYPFSFGEFLTALGKEDLRNQMDKEFLKTISEPLHKQLLQYVRDYTVIGGMPAVVQKFITTQSFQECQRIQTELVENFQKDFGKYAKQSQIKYLRQLWDAIPSLLGNKFVYAHVSTEYKSRDLSQALDLLEMAGIAHRVYHSSCSGIPLGATADFKKFKVLFFDTGMVLRILGTDLKTIILNPDIALINKGAIAELFTGLEWIAYGNPQERPKLYYWQREERGAQSEVDYVLPVGKDIIPVEVKSGDTGRLFSLNRFLKEKKAPWGLKISSSPYARNDPIEQVPFYGLETLFKNFR